MQANNADCLPSRTVRLWYMIKVENIRAKKLIVIRDGMLGGTVVWDVNYSARAEELSASRISGGVSYVKAVSPAYWDLIKEPADKGGPDYIIDLRGTSLQPEDIIVTPRA